MQVRGLALLFLLLPWAARPCPAQITELIDNDGDGLGNTFLAPSSVAVGLQGDVYVAGGRTDNVFRIPPAGSPVLVLDTAGFGSGHFLCEPRDLALDASGNVYVAGNMSNNVFRITPAGVVTQVLDFAGDGMGNFLDGPDSVAVDPAGNLFVSGQNSNNVLRRTPSGSVTEIIDVLGDGLGHFLDGPTGLATDAVGNVYVAGEISRNVFRIEPNGVITEIIDFSGDGLGNLLIWPREVAVGPSGSVYVTGYLSENAFVRTPDGVVREIIDDEGDPDPQNDLDRPMGIVVSAAGNVYVAGTQSNNVFLVSPMGTVTEIADNSGPGNLLNEPVALAVDALGNVYAVCDDSDNAVKIARPREYPSHCAGDGGDQMGCTDCPCSNDAPSGTFGGCLNGVGLSARLVASGDSSVSLPPSSTTDLRFELSGGNPGAFAILTSGDALAPNNPMNPCFGLGSGLQAMNLDGLRCAVGSPTRHGSRPIDAMGNVGINSLPWGGEGAPLLGIAQNGVSYAAGQKRFFQVVYRELPTLSCMTGLNSSQAVEVLFTP